MSSGLQGNSNQTIFLSGTPHFFTIILEKTLQENKLWIPQKFIRKCGATLSNSVFVKLPCGSKWKMKLTKQDNKMWLEKGWPDFAKHYSIKRGSMLVFRYEGKSEFHVVIFDTSTVEIDYPSIPVHFDKSDIDSELQAPKQEVVEDDSIELLDDLSPCPKARAKSPLPCSQPHKRMRMSPNAECQSNSFDPKSKSSHHSESVLGNSMTKRNLQSSEPEFIGKHDLPSKSDNDISIHKASVFKSRRPFFKVVMQPSYLRDNRVTFSSNFAKRYIKSNSCNVILKVLDGRTWSVKYTFGVFHRFRTRFHPRFYGGWKEFSRDNNLGVGDVCVFVLLEGMITAFEVVIFRVHGNSKSPSSSAHKGGTIQLEPEDILTNKTQSGGAVNYETGEPSSLNSVPAKQASRYMSTPWKTSQCSVTRIERARILESVPFESEKPFFKVVMQPSYVGSKADYLLVPSDFATRHIKNQGVVVLSVPNGKSWFAKLRMTDTRFISCATKLFKGWREFANDNNLKVGDVCIFKLVDGTKNSFEVSIVRFAEYECNYAASACKSMAYAKSGRGKSTTRRKKTDQSLQRMKTQMYRSEKVTSLQKAIAFKSSCPFFKVVIQPSYIYGDHLDFPHEFARTHLKNKSNDAILIVSYGGRRTWPVDYNFIMHEKTSTARFEYGWIPFAQDNNLEVGDVCVFVLLDCTKTTFRVVIFRVNENSKAPISPTHEGRANPVEVEEILTSETRSCDTKNAETGEPSSLFSVPAKQASGYMSTPKKRRIRSLTSTERARILEGVPFKSDKPYFKLLMQPSYVGSKADCLHLPINFVMTYVKTEGDAVLSVLSGRSWFAELTISQRKSSHYVAKIVKGWREFVEDNNIEVGDVCIFKLLDGTKISFEVSIVRFAEYECDYATSASKPKGAVKVKTEFD